MKHLVVLSLVSGLLAAAGSCLAQSSAGRLPEPQAAPGFVPAGGFVPDAATAVQIAEAVWLPIYGTNVLHEKPFTARLTGEGVWIVEGSLPEGMKGGVAYLEISKRDGRILAVTHGK